MAFKDYSTTPADNTLLGDGTYIGPNMLRNKVRPALQQIAADGRDLYDEMAELIGDIPAGPAGDVAAAAGRSALAAIVGQDQGATRYLYEAGREGTFVFETGDHTGVVAADPNQAMYVAPTIYPTGASGAWARKFDGPVNVKWFGAAPGASAATNGAAFEAAIAYLKAIATDERVYYKASTTLLIPQGTYALDRTLDITHTFKMLGENSNALQGNSSATVLSWPDGMDGIRTQRYNTSGTGTVDGVTHFAGDGFALENVRLIGGYAGTEGEYHGIRNKCLIHIRNVIIQDWSGDGIFSHNDTGGVGELQGNSNTSKLEHVFITNCRDGFSITGGDANAWIIIGLDITGNRRWGRNDTSFLGNTYIGGHAADNGLIPGTPPSVVSHAGNRYAIKDGQETGGSTNAPSGTTADNTWWYYLSAGGVNTGLNIPAWSSSMTLRAGGAGKFMNANARTLLLGAYTEGGQGPIQGDHPAMAIGGMQGSGVKGTMLSVENYSGTLNAAQVGAINPVTGYGNYLTADRLEFNRATDQFTWEWFANDLALTALRSSSGSVWAMRLTGELTTANIGKRKIDFPNGFGLADKKVLSGTAAPVAGTYVQGDMVFNSAPTASNPMGWMCVTGGTPGTWKAMANLAA